MKIREFAVLMCAAEGKKKQVSVAQMMEILKVMNLIFSGDLYKKIRTLPKP